MTNHWFLIISEALKIMTRTLYIESNIITFNDSYKY